MKKRLQKFGEDIVPLSSRQSFLLFLLIACVFQFLFFFTPALAAETVADQENIIALGNINKSLEMDADAQKVANSTKTQTNVEIKATSTPEKATSTPKVKSVSTHVMTAYNSEVAQTDSSPCITANGFNVCKHGIEDTIAANFLKMGTKVRIPELYGDRVFVVRDRMNAKHPNRVDIWMKDRASAIKFGVKTAKIEVLE
jgi:3D (Asp-Asp-Asp) domain-containing protein